MAVSPSISRVGRLITSGLTRAAGAVRRQRKPLPQGATALRLACAAALDLPLEELRPGVVRIEPIEGSYAPFGSPCPLAVVQTLEGAAARVFGPLLDDLGPLLAEPVGEGAVLSAENRKRLIEALDRRIPVREISHQILFYTDREHFIPEVRHRVVPLDQAQRPLQQGESNARGACGVLVRGQPAAYADYSPRGEHCMSLGVYTDERFRGEGLGTSVVSVATRKILDQGKIPLYSANLENAASQAVCTSLGYVKFGEALYCFM